MSTRVTNVHYEACDVFVGRGGSLFGNPYSHREDTLAAYKVATREEALAKYTEWLKSQPTLLALIPSLRGKSLGCYCRPAKGFRGKLMCHAQIIAGLADGIPPEEVE